MSVKPIITLSKCMQIFLDILTTDFSMVVDVCDVEFLLLTARTCTCRISPRIMCMTVKIYYFRHKMITSPKFLVRASSSA